MLSGVILQKNTWYCFTYWLRFWPLTTPKRPPLPPPTQWNFVCGACITGKSYFIKTKRHFVSRNNALACHDKPLALLSTFNCVFFYVQQTIISNESGLQHNRDKLHHLTLNLVLHQPIISCKKKTETCTRLQMTNRNKTPYISVFLLALLLLLNGW